MMQGDLPALILKESGGDVSVAVAMKSDAGTDAWMIASDLWLPYRILDFEYDPLASFERQATAGVRAAAAEGLWPDPVRREGAFVLWSATELDLTRFARDPFVRKNLAAAVRADDATTERLEERRFARLNGLLRAIAMAALPSGAPPRRWRARLERRTPPRLPRICERFGARVFGSGRPPAALAEAVAVSCERLGCEVIRPRTSGYAASAD